jgi:hypothetical protein
MKIIASCLTLLALLATLSPSASSAQTLAEKSFVVTAESEGSLDLTASVPGASWREKGREAAAVTVYLDDRYHQDLFLYNGPQRTLYQVSLGRIQPGAHKVRIELNRSQSAAGVQSAVVHLAEIKPVWKSHPEFAAIAHAPVLYARPDTIGHFSDIPLLMYVETERNQETTLYRYTVIFSNEDGGTQSAALMARWGRTTDIEWVIETTIDAQGKILKSVFQGANHVTTPFQGRYEADHPVLLTATVNNNFADKGDTKMRFALRPILVDLSAQSREEVMDRYPWIYRIMAEEMIREGKITAERTLGARIADLRQYLYIDAASQQQGGTGLSFAVKLKGNSQWFTSDLGINYHKIDRSGYFRTTVRLPGNISLRAIDRIAVRCDLINSPRNDVENEKAAAAGCNLQSVNKAFLLDASFQPASSLLFENRPVKLQFGEMVELDLRETRAARQRE